MNQRACAARYTFEEFCALVKEDEKADLIDGVIYMASPENTDANDLGGWLYCLMRLFNRGGKLGKVYISRVAYKLDESNGPEPDIGFVPRERLHTVQRGRVVGPPDLAVEIVSPESEERDYVKKRQMYERFGVKEYWILDELKERVTLLRLGAGGKYRQVRAKNGELHSRAFPGFWLRTEWLWQKPLPDPEDVLAEIRARQA